MELNTGAAPILVPDLVLDDKVANLQIDRIASPIGTVMLVARDEKIIALEFHDHWDRTKRTLTRRFGNFELTRVDDPGGNSSRVRRYFDGDQSAFDGCSVDPGGTEFQRKVWITLPEIGWGQTLSYGELAIRIDKPSSSRAVGAANGQNPIALVLPCHRVIGADGSLTGYAGGLKRKQWLLAHESGNRNLELNLNPDE